VQREDAALEVPVCALPDPGLALEPAPLRLLDVLGARREDVEDEAPARHEERERGRERGAPVRVRVEVQERPEGRGDEAHVAVHRRVAEVS
jgi:hypothetical protein